MSPHSFSLRIRPILSLILLPILFYSLSACKKNKNQVSNAQMRLHNKDIIEVVTQNMDFQAVDTIPSGWHTFRYTNKSKEPHFFLLDKYPEDKTIKDAEREVMPIFQQGMDLINEGKPAEGFATLNSLPNWFFKVVFSGGSALVSPGEQSVTTLFLEPGYYVMECYVKMSNGMFHSTMGMTKELIVTQELSNGKPLVPDVKLTISSTEGISYNTPIQNGHQVFSVFFKDQISHENFVGHDVNLVRLDKNADVNHLEKWMNWAAPEGLMNPAPEGVTFLGGVNDLPKGKTGYFNANLAPGHYAFIAEVPNARSKKMFHVFTVPEPTQEAKNTPFPQK
ncbi:hypothetical protein SAMN04487911_101133 [Arenibacter nanhaiticus]|uniref:Uncharacterized protein n=1 Tax=Arenibacter nanhaiticus TaxID=558155 RepID=A0A1M6A8Z5_9FLAO|nr:hypothetical protein [Arenibacter nanhaiticus]SHI32945.1 hypothetical protein SAMN04487911_101133 [Arenibacter nanhaiticus]